MLIGYARVSTQDQNLDLQRGALIGAGCDKVAVEEQWNEKSGKAI